jgi:hypothetical protein
MRARLKAELLIEEIDGAYLICDGDSGVVHRLEGPAAGLVGRLRDGHEIDVSSDVVAATLVDLGILVSAPEVSGLEMETERGVVSPMTRRRLLQLGAAATAVGVVTMVLPSAAAASSHDVPDPSDIAITTNTQDNNRYARVRLTWLFEDHDPPGPVTYSYTGVLMEDVGGTLVPVAGTATSGTATGTTTYMTFGEAWTQDSGYVALLTASSGPVSWQVYVPRPTQ